MKECLWCKKEFQEKKPTAKYCSTSCRVMFNKKHGKKNELKPFQMQVLYNQIMEAVNGINQKNSLPESFGAVINTENKPSVTVKIPPQELYQNTTKSFQQFMNEIADLEFPEEYKKLTDEINNSNLPTKQKELLIKNMQLSKMNRQ